MTPPARPTASLAPVCSGCQCVLTSVSMRLPPVAFLTAASSASAFAARPPSIIKAPSGPRIAITLHPAPCSSIAPPRSVLEIRREACAPSPKAEAGSSAPPTAAAPTCRKDRRDVRPDSHRIPVVPPAPGSVDIAFIDGLVDTRLAKRPDVLPDALRRTEHRPHRTSAQEFRRAKLAKQGRLVFVHRCLQRHEGHEAARLCVVQ